ncbi:MAG TPA: GntR family transcriptional regulator [Dongiaceae bacterium]|jgi:DNA-binding GntR family transcriptional regulator|nr:GntR family transcriptional regulator [Dongiaceae bacterium]
MPKKTERKPRAASNAAPKRVGAGTAPKLAGAGNAPRRTRRQRGTGAAYVYDSLKAQILDLELKPGTLLDETVVSRQFGVSRSPVREALIRLSAEGLVQNLRNRTSIVAPFDVETLPAYFDAMQLLYRLSARLAAGNAKPGGLEQLRRIMHEHETALRKGDMRAMVHHNRDFHIAIAEMSGNPFLAGWMSGLLDQGQRILRLYARHFGDQLPDTRLKSHRDMLSAIAAGDADKAEAAGRADAQALIDDFKRNLSDRPAALLELHTSRPRRMSER